jgi:hypothetical protein
MPSAAVYAGNTVVNRNGTPIAEARSYRFRRTANFVETTPFKANRYEEGLVGIISASIEIDVNWKFASHTGLNDDFEDGVSQVFSIGFPAPDSSSLSFNAVVLEISVDGRQGQEQRGSVQLRLDGAPTWT